MYPITDEAAELFCKNYRQTAEITFYGADETFTLTEKNIVTGGLTVDRCSVSNSNIELGSAIASELSLLLDNSKGEFNNTKFEGAELFVRIGVKKYEAHKWERAVTHYVPLGYFTVDEPARALRTISLSALDRMVLFDKKVDWSQIGFPITVEELLSKTCFLCNVPLGEYSDRPNLDYEVSERPMDETTYRQIIQWIAELTASCAFIDWEGKLCLSWYTPTSVRISPSERYSSDMLENDIVISGVEIADDENNTFISGNNSYAFRIEGNSLIQHNYQEVCDAIFNEVGGFSYRPYECVIKPMPYLFPMDTIEYIDKDGASHNTIVTNITFTLNGSTAVKGQGETAAKNGYASANPLTKHESVIISNLKKEQNKTLESRTQAVLRLNETIANSLGLHETVVKQADGSKTTYFHNEPSIEQSSVIYVRNAGGFAWSNSWNNGNPVWQYGFTKDGNAVYNALSTWKIQTEYLDAECVTAEKLSLDYRNSVKNDIAESAGELRQSFKVGLGNLNSQISETYSTKKNTDEAIQTKASEIKQTTDEIVASVKETKDDLKNNYSTKTETNSAIEAKADSVLISAKKEATDYTNGVLKDYSTSAQIKTTTDAIILEVGKKVNSSDIGTQITQNAQSVQIAWNSKSKYIAFENGEINIYSSASHENNNLLMKMNDYGAAYYYKGNKVGKIGTNGWANDANFRGLIFELEQTGSYMCWAHRNGSEGNYIVKLAYYAANKDNKKQGLNFHCNTYCNNNPIYINDNVRTVSYIEGGGGLCSDTHSVWLKGKGSPFECGDDFIFHNSKNRKVHCYNNIDLYNYAILNQSDARLKTNIEPTEIEALPLLSKIKLKKFDWIESGEHCQIGMIAQQVREIFPDLVSEDNETGRLSLKIDKFTPYLIKAIQELTDYITGGVSLMSIDPEEWTDGYSEEEKRLFVEANQPDTPIKEIAEGEPLLIPIFKPNGQKS